MANVNNPSSVKETVKKKKLIWKTIITILLILIIISVLKGRTTCGVVSDGKNGIEDLCKTCRCVGISILENRTPPNSKCIGIDLGCK